MDFQQAKSFLSTQNNGTSLYEHLGAMVRKIIEEKPENALDLFENISLAVKESKLNVEYNDIQPIPIDNKEKNELQNKLNDILMFYGKKPEKKAKNEEPNEENENAEEENEENEEPIDQSKCATILPFQNLLQWAGIGISNEEMYQLQHSFCSLIRKYPNIQSSRFWGKVQGINNDYWIVESKLAEYPEKKETDSAKMEDPGKGVNEYVYYVTTNVENAEWLELPNVTPEQIKKCRNVYRLFSGDLNAKIGGRVYFEWTEKELLRTQIARISSATILAPNEYYKKPEEEDEENPFIIEENEEFAPLEDAFSTKSWCHSRAHLRLEGRIKKWIEPEKEEEDEEEKEEKEPTKEELEEVIDILQDISNDKCSEYEINEESEDTNVWKLRQLNEKIGFGITIIRNKLWFGANTIYQNGTKQFINIYVGNGLKYRPTYYTPVLPATIQESFNEFKETEIPNPDNEEETITKKESIYVVQEEQFEPPKEENNDAENNENEAEAQD